VYSDQTVCYAMLKIKHKHPIHIEIADVNIIAHSARGGFTIIPELCESIFHDILDDTGARSVIKDCMGISTIEDFSVFLNDSNKMFFFAIAQHKVASMTWIDFTGERNGRVHFVVFRRAYGGINLISGLATLQYIFNTNIFDSLIGFTPTDNKLALRFNKLLGFVELGVAPLSHYDDVKRISNDAMVTYCTKDRISEVIREYEQNKD